MIDSHAHIAMLVEEKGIPFSEIFGKAKEKKVNKIVNVLTSKEDISTSFQANEVVPKEIDLYHVAGVHPHDANDADASWVEPLKEKIIAIGEVGLDFHYDFATKENQEKMFRKMIALSLELKKPLILHAREAEERAIEILKDYALKGKKVLFHSFTGSLETAEKIFNNGWFVSFSGILTFKKSHLLEILKASPLDRILFETDSPYLAPTPFRGQINTPDKVSEIYKFVAKEIRMKPEFLDDEIDSNFKHFFDLD